MSDMSREMLPDAPQIERIKAAHEYRKFVDRINRTTDREIEEAERRTALTQEPKP